MMESHHYEGLVASTSDPPTISDIMHQAINARVFPGGAVAFGTCNVPFYYESLQYGNMLISSMFICLEINGDGLELGIHQLSEHTPSDFDSWADLVICSQGCTTFLGPSRPNLVARSAFHSIVSHAPYFRLCLLSVLTFRDLFPHWSCILLLSSAFGAGFTAVYSSVN
eukprot:Gb_05106 [translate_table: standard]